MSTNSFNLSNLPSDVIRMIIGNMGLLEVDNLRLISPRWDTIVVGHLSDPNRRPALKWFRWDNDEDGRTVFFRATQCEYFTHSPSSAADKITMVLKRCSRISNIRLSLADFQAIKSVLCTIPIEVLTITGGDYLQPHSKIMILDFLRFCSANAHPIHRLVLSSQEILLHLDTQFFIQSATLVTEINLLFSEPQNPSSQIPLFMNAWKYAFNATHQLTARIKVENNGMNTVYRLVVKAL